MQRHTHRINSALRFRLSRIIDFQKVFLIAVGICMGWLCFAESVYAANGFTRVAACGCSTTAAFSSAALATAGNGVAEGQYVTGTYTLVSTTTNKMAYVAVTSSRTRSGSTTYSITPIDATGKSLVGESESSQEAYYVTLDAATFGTSRSNPVFGTTTPADFPAQFANTTDTQMSADIDTLLSDMGISVGPGSTFTVKFGNSDTAEFVAQPAGTNPPWKWNGNAWNKAKQPIDRTGKVIQNTNTSGSGGGSVTAPGYGPGANWYFYLGGGNDCTMTSTAGDDEIGFYGVSWLVPC